MGVAEGLIPVRCSRQLGRLSSPLGPSDLMSVLNEAEGERLMASLLTHPPLPRPETKSATHDSPMPHLEEMVKLLSTGSVQSPRRTMGTLFQTPLGAGIPVGLRAQTPPIQPVIVKCQPLMSRHLPPPAKQSLAQPIQGRTLSPLANRHAIYAPRGKLLGIAPRVRCSLSPGVLCEDWLLVDCLHERS